MSGDLKLGQIIAGAAERDAIHIAVAPLVAGEPLRPGDHVGLVDGQAMAATAVETDMTPIGIVDPFLRHVVGTGERFWLLLYPNTITALRHEWTHPAFKGEAPLGPKGAAEAFMRDYADEVGLSVGAVLDAGREFLRDGDHHVLRYDLPDMLFERRGEFWRHYETLTGETVPPEQLDDVPFSCSC